LKKPLAVETVWSELLLYGGEWKSRKAIYDELIASGYATRYVDYYLFCLSQHQPKKEDYLKTIHVIASAGNPIMLCPKCHEVKEEITAFFRVPLYPELSKNDQGKTVQPEMLSVLFRPMYYCQCARLEAERGDRHVGLVDGCQDCSGPGTRTTAL
jgi:hypothetical protein